MNLLPSWFSYKYINSSTMFLSGVCNEYGRHTRIWNSDFVFVEKIFLKYFLSSRSRTHILFYFSDFEISKSEIIKIIFLTSIFLSQKNKKKYEFDLAKSEKYFLIWVRLHQVEEIFFYIFLISPNRTRSQNSNYEFEKMIDWSHRKKSKIDSNSGLQKLL